MGSSAAPDLAAKVLRHERALVAASLATLAALAWWYLLTRSSMTGMAAMRPPRLAALVVMWSLMMVAMMLPSATPAILLYSRVRERITTDPAVAQTWVFLAGYLAIWLIFSIGAAVAQMSLTGSSMALDGQTAQSAVLIAAGVYQLSPLKSACVRQCRSPAEFLTRHWRPGWHGAVQLGLRHGAYCLGCCWMLMALLFVGGVMNLLWVVALTVIVAVEKLVPGGPVVGRIAGVALIGWGLMRLVI